MPASVLMLSLMLDQGGSERQLAEMAMAMDRNRYLPHVGTFRAYGMRAKELAAQGVPILDLHVRSFRSWGALRGARALRQYIRQNNIDVVHTFDAPLTVFATPVTRYFTNAALISSQRGHRNLTPELRKLLRVTDPRVDAVIVNCQYLKRHLAEDEGVREDKIEVCYNGMDLSRFSAPVQRPAALDGASAVIGSLCALRPEKGLRHLVAAFAGLKPAERGLKLALVGSGPEGAALQNLARELSIESCCVFEPATAEIAPWLKSMDIFVMPSLEEAFSNAIMEAMACSCAVVASDVGGNPELAGSGRGVLVPPGQTEPLQAALEKLLTEPDQRKQWAHAGRDFVETQLTRERAAARMADVYDRVLSKRRR